MTQTFTGCRWDPDADKVLKSQHAGQEAAVLGPDLSDGFPPAFKHDGYQGEGVKHGVEVHPLPNYIDHQQQARLRKTHEEYTHEGKEFFTYTQRMCFALLIRPYLQSKLVEEVVDEIFDEADNADVQMLPCDVMENNPGSRGRQFVPQSEVFLMTVDGHLER